jgi:hypothetical protein
MRITVEMMTFSNALYRAPSSSFTALVSIRPEICSDAVTVKSSPATSERPRALNSSLSVASSASTALERAFELARSGRYLRLDQLLRRLNSEGYLGEQVTGPAVRKQLSQAIKESRSRPPFSPAASREQRGLGAAMVLLAREQLRALRPILLAPIGPLPPFHASASEWPMLLTLRCSIYIHVWSA